jgi:predicted O-methyltransferase YrrM
LYTARHYAKYLLRAKNLHGIHSPFIYEFNEKVLNDGRTFYAYQEIEALRKEYLANSSSITINDMGAGSHKGQQSQAAVNSIVSSAARHRKYGALLFRIQNFYKYSSVIELGTSLGIGLAYVAKANVAAQIHTIEGNPQISAAAQKGLQSINLGNIEFHIGNFDDVLPTLLKQIADVEFAIVDGNHRYDATLRYCDALWSKLSTTSLLVFDDIYWSEGMTKAWREIKARNGVFVTVDLFQFGLVFKHPNITTKQHYTLRF